MAGGAPVHGRVDRRRAVLSAGALAVLAVLAVLLALVVVAAPAAAAPEDAQITDEADDVDNPLGQDLGPLDDWPDVLAVWVAGETNDSIEFHVEVSALPPAWNEATDGRPTEPYRVTYDIRFTFLRGALPGVPGFEETIREDHLLTVVVSRGISTEKPGDLLVGATGCLWDGEPANGTAERVSDAEVLCRIPRQTLLPDDAGDTVYRGDLLFNFNATGQQDVPPLQDPANGSGFYLFEVVEPLPAPTGAGAGGGDGGDGADGGTGGDGPGDGDGDGAGGQAGGSGDGTSSNGAGNGGGGTDAPGEATPGPGLPLVAAAVATAAAVGVHRRRRRDR